MMRVLEFSVIRLKASGIKYEDQMLNAVTPLSFNVPYNKDPKKNKENI